MRIAGNMVSRRYLDNYARNYGAMIGSEEKVESNRKYKRASESPIEATKALKIRKTMAEVETYQDNLKTADTFYSTAEESLMTISTLIQSTYESLIYGANGTQNQSDMDTISLTVDNYGDEMVQLMNVAIADRKIFGAANNETIAYSTQRSVTGDKTAYYNGVAVDTYDDPESFPQGISSFLDIGLGMTVGADGRIDEQTALEITFNGAEALGCGMSKSTTFLGLDGLTAGTEYSLDFTVGGATQNIKFVAGTTAEASKNALNTALETAYGADTMKVYPSGLIEYSGKTQVTVENAGDAVEDVGIDVVESGFSNNVIQLLYDAAQCLRSGDQDKVARYADVIYAAQSKVSNALSNIGTKTQFIEFNDTRLTNNMYTLKEKQNELEFTDLPTEITKWKTLESVYNASLQMGTTVIPMSVFDYIK